MSTSRLEAFSDGVIAILITIMVLELPRPHGTTLGGAARRCCRCSSAYVLSFVYLGIYWNNHHHMLQATDAGQRRDPLGEPAPALLALAGPVRRRRGWGRTTSPPLPTAVYGVVLLRRGVAYFVLQQAHHPGQGPALAASPRPSAATRRASCPRSSTRSAIALAFVSRGSRSRSTSPWR